MFSLNIAILEKSFQVQGLGCIVVYCTARQKGGEWWGAVHPLHVVKCGDGDGKESLNYGIETGVQRGGVIRGFGQRRWGWGRGQGQGDGRGEPYGVNLQCLLGKMARALCQGAVCICRHRWSRREINTCSSNHLSYLYS